MAYEFRNLIWLCWILCSLVSLIEGQFGGSDFRGGGGSFGAPAGFGSGGLSFGNGAGFRGGGSRNGGKSGSDRSGQDSGNRADRFGGGGEGDAQRGSQQGDQMAEEAVPSLAVPSTDPAMPLASTAAMAEEMVPTIDMISSAPISPTEAALEQPSSVADAFSEPSSTLLAPPGIPLVLPTSAVSNNIAFTTASSEQFPSSTFDRPTVTTSMTSTLWVTPSPMAETSAAPAEEASSPPTTTTEASPSASMNTAPLSTSSGTTMSVSKQAGMGVGITFGLLGVAGAASLYLWRRRRNRQLDRDNLTPRNRKFDFGRFFHRRSRSQNDPRNDPEWSIESASKVEILRGGSIRSIRTGSPSNSLASSFPLPSVDKSPLSRLQPPAAVGGNPRDGTTLEVLRVGMRVPDRKPNLALTSNPPVSPGSFPSPPTSRGGEKTSSWPLSN